MQGRGRPQNRVQDVPISDLRQWFFEAARTECRNAITTLRDNGLPPFYVMYHERGISYADLFWPLGDSESARVARNAVQDWAKSYNLGEDFWALQLAVACLWHWVKNEQAADTLRFPWELGDDYMSELKGVERRVQVEFSVPQPEEHERVFEKYRKRVWSEVESKTALVLLHAWETFGKASNAHAANLNFCHWPRETVRLRGLDDKIMRGVARRVCLSQAWVTIGTALHLDESVLRKRGNEILGHLRGKPPGQK